MRGGWGYSCDKRRMFNFYAPWQRFLSFPPRLDEVKLTQSDVFQSQHPQWLGTAKIRDGFWTYPVYWITFGHTGTSQRGDSCRIFQVISQKLGNQSTEKDKHKMLEIDGVSACSIVHAQELCSAPSWRAVVAAFQQPAQCFGAGGSGKEPQSGVFFNLVPAQEGIFWSARYM